MEDAYLEQAKPMPIPNSFRIGDNPVDGGVGIAVS